MSEWQPIETAPKNGSLVLGYDQRRLTYAMRYWEPGSCWDSWPAGFVNPKPTHWQPLPKPPGEA